MSLRKVVFTAAGVGIGLTGTVLYGEDMIEQSLYEGAVEQAASHQVQQSLDYKIQRRASLGEEGIFYSDLCSLTHDYLSSQSTERADRFSQEFNGIVATNMATSFYVEIEGGRQIHTDFTGRYTVEPQLAWGNASGQNDVYHLVANLELSARTYDDDLDSFESDTQIISSDTYSCPRV